MRKNTEAPWFSEKTASEAPWFLVKSCSSRDLQEIVMGYSCTQAAHLAEEFIRSRIADPKGPTNTWVFEGLTYFYEIGRENRDGSITGPVCVFVGENRCRNVGSLKIDHDGALIRWPFIPGIIRRLVRKAYTQGDFKDKPIFQFVLEPGNKL
jgi:hypothetical protein